MTNADKMFEELGYIIHFKYNDTTVEYQRSRLQGYFEYITFNGNSKTVEKNEPITMPELNAIKEKVKELGWYD